MFRINLQAWGEAGATLSQRRRMARLVLSPKARESARSFAAHGRAGIAAVSGEPSGGEEMISHPTDFSAGRRGTRWLQDHEMHPCEVAATLTLGSEMRKGWEAGFLRILAIRGQFQAARAPAPSGM
jgi:hypothetical protein